MNIQHPVEATRGMVASGDAYSPGWLKSRFCRKTINLIFRLEQIDRSQLFWMNLPKEDLPRTLQ
jgi:hypothetical protein